MTPLSQIKDICPYIQLNEYRKRVKKYNVKIVPPEPLTLTTSVEKLIVCGYKEYISHEANSMFSSLHKRIKIYFWTAS